MTHGNSTHGMKGTPTWVCWQSMLQRCGNPKHKSFARYGGRGIVVCERWGRFEDFLADMGEKPAGLTLERSDNAKGYEPGNCRWATHEEQARNRSNNRPMTFDGVTKTVIEWAEDPRCPVTANTLGKRLEAGWSFERAMTQPRREQRSPT